MATSKHTVELSIDNTQALAALRQVRREARRIGRGMSVWSNLWRGALGGIAALVVEHLLR